MLIIKRVPKLRQNYTLGANYIVIFKAEAREKIKSKWVLKHNGKCVPNFTCESLLPILNLTPGMM